MQLEFKKQNGLYEVEFEVTGNFNLHLERKNYGRIELYQKTSSETNYTSSPSYSTNGDAVINLDFSMGIYPKFVKIISYTEVEKAIVTMEGESSGSGVGGYKLVQGSRIHYFQGESLPENLDTTEITEYPQFIKYCFNLKRIPIIDMINMQPTIGGVSPGMYPNMVHECPNVEYMLIKNLGADGSQDIYFDLSAMWGYGSETNRKSLVDSLLTYSKPTSEYGLKVYLNISVYLRLKQEEIDAMVAKGVTPVPFDRNTAGE